ncbi:MAG: glycine oxidase ThiO [Planctomycetaceae bacterium]|nr:glycine oxidase ThiO [Planctomycetales bacterium]MCB9873496.1 glycine oxidase ThiO [Planctomycetaceae bacterium]MCB9940406.1 glycine oxidase ThiO [Planctomycetaceae bacterium]
MSANSTPEILIVGGGVVGLSLAYELAVHGSNVQLIDRASVGREASWAGAGILPPVNRATAIDPLDRLRALSHQLHREWAVRLREETGVDNGYRECGGLYLARSAGEVASLHAFAEMLRDLEIEIERLTPSEVAELEPALSDVAASQLKAVYSLPGEAQLRNPDHLKALRLACERRGVDIVADREATGFELSNSRLAAVQTTTGPLHADQYCITSGAWTQRLLMQVGISTGIMPIRGQMVMFKCEVPPFRRILNEGPRYLVPRDDGRVLVGSTEEEAGFDKSTTPEGVGELVALARQLVPELRDAPIENSWAGLRPGSFDSFPYIGRLSGIDNAFAGAGHYRSGLHMSPGTAVVLRQLMFGEEPEIDLTPFRVGRG